MQHIDRKCHSLSPRKGRDPATIILNSPAQVSSQGRGVPPDVSIIVRGNRAIPHKDPIVEAGGGVLKHPTIRRAWVCAASAANDRDRASRTSKPGGSKRRGEELMHRREARMRNTLLGGVGQRVQCSHPPVDRPANSTPYLSPSSQRRPRLRASVWRIT